MRKENQRLSRSVGTPSGRDEIAGEGVEEKRRAPTPAACYNLTVFPRVMIPRRVHCSCVHTTAHRCMNEPLRLIKHTGSLRPDGYTPAEDVPTRLWQRPAVLFTGVDRASLLIRRRGGGRKERWELQKSEAALAWTSVTSAANTA